MLPLGRGSVAFLRNGAHVSMAALRAARAWRTLASIRLATQKRRDVEQLLEILAEIGDTVADCSLALNGRPVEIGVIRLPGDRPAG